MTQKIVNGNLTGTVTNGLPQGWHWYGVGNSAPYYYDQRDTGDPSGWHGWYQPTSGHPDGGGCLQIGGGGRGINNTRESNSGDGWIQYFALTAGKIYTVTCDLMVHTPTYRTNKCAIGVMTGNAYGDLHRIINFFSTYSGLCSMGWKTIPIARFKAVTHVDETYVRFYANMHETSESEAYIRLKNISIIESDEENMSRKHWTYSGVEGDFWTDFPDFDTKTSTTKPTGTLTKLEHTLAQHERALTQVCVRPAAQWNNAKITYDGLSGLEINWRLGVFMHVHNPSYTATVDRGRTSIAIEPLVSVTDTVAPTGSTSVFYVDIYVPPGTTAGLHTGNIYIKDGATTKATIPVEVTVRDFSLTVKNSERTFRNHLLMMPEDRNSPNGKMGHYWNRYGGETVSPEVMKKYWKEVFEIGYGSTDFGLIFPSDADQKVTQANNPLLYAMREYLDATGCDLPCGPDIIDLVQDGSQNWLDAHNFMEVPIYQTGTANLTSEIQAVAPLLFEHVYTALGNRPWFSYSVEERDLKNDLTSLQINQSKAWFGLKKAAAPGLQICGTGKISDQQLADGLVDWFYPSGQAGDNFMFCDGATESTVLGLYLNPFQGSIGAPQWPLFHWMMMPLSAWAWGAKGGVEWWNITGWNGGSWPLVDKNPWYDTTPYNVTIGGSTINMFYPPDSATSGYADYPNTPTPSIRWRAYCLGVGLVMYAEKLQDLIAGGKGTAPQRVLAQASLDRLKTDIVPSLPYGETIEQNLFGVMDYDALDAWKEEVAGHILTLSAEEEQVITVHFRKLQTIPTTMTLMLLNDSYTYGENQTVADLQAYEISGGGAVSFSYASKTVTISEEDINSGATPFKALALVSDTKVCAVWELPKALAGSYALTFEEIPTSR